MAFLLVFPAYSLGAIPFGYLIVKVFQEKDASPFFLPFHFWPSLLALRSFFAATRRLSAACSMERRTVRLGRKP